LSKRERIAELPFVIHLFPPRSLTGHNKVSKRLSREAGVARLEN